MMRVDLAYPWPQTFARQAALVLRDLYAGPSHEYLGAIRVGLAAIDGLSLSPSDARALKKIIVDHFLWISPLRHATSKDVEIALMLRKTLGFDDVRQRILVGLHLVEWKWDTAAAWENSFAERFWQDSLRRLETLEDPDVRTRLQDIIRATVAKRPFLRSSAGDSP